MRYGIEGGVHPHPCSCWDKPPCSVNCLNAYNLNSTLFSELQENIHSIHTFVYILVTSNANVIVPLRRLEQGCWTSMD